MPPFALSAASRAQLQGVHPDLVRVVERAITLTPLAIPIEWGGHWRSFPDGPHFQLPWKHYP